MLGFKSIDALIDLNAHIDHKLEEPLFLS